MVRRAGNLYGKIADPDNLRLAYLNARRGKMGRPAVRDYSLNLDMNLSGLRNGLLNLDLLRLGDYHYFMVFDPKPRMICAASFNERVLHHAVMNVCEPVFEKFAIYDSYACRKGKGGTRALKRAQYFCGKYSWYLKLDIRKYFDSIVHEVLLNKLGWQFREKQLLALFAKLLATYETLPGQGLPIGNLISQHFANFYLGSFDHWLKNGVRVRGYLRYMDDFLLFADNKAILRKWLDQLEVFLRCKLGLKVKSNIQLNRTVFGIPFLGYRVFSGHLRLKQESRRRFTEKFRLYEKLHDKGLWSEAELQKHVEPLLSFIRRAKTERFRKKILVAVY